MLCWNFGDHPKTTWLHDDTEGKYIKFLALYIVDIIWTRYFINRLVLCIVDREFTLCCKIRIRLVGQVYSFSLLICYPYSSLLTGLFFNYIVNSLVFTYSKWATETIKKFWYLFKINNIKIRTTSSWLCSTISLTDFEQMLEHDLVFLLLPWAGTCSLRCLLNWWY